MIWFLWGPQFGEIMGQWLGGGHGGQACFLQALLSTPKNPAQALMSPPDPALPPHACPSSTRRLHFSNTNMSKCHSSPSPSTSAWGWGGGWGRKWAAKITSSKCFAHMRTHTHTHRYSWCTYSGQSHSQEFYELLCGWYLEQYLAQSKHTIHVSCHP